LGDNVGGEGEGEERELRGGWLGGRRGMQGGRFLDTFEDPTKNETKMRPK